MPETPLTTPPDKGEKAAPQRKQPNMAMTLFKIALILGIMGYLVFAFSKLSGEDHTSVKTVDVIIVDSTRAGFITEQEVASILRKAGLYPMGMEMSKVNGESIQNELKKNSFIRQAICFKTPGGHVNIKVQQRLPILRVKNHRGDDFYIDADGSRMRTEGYNADLIVATGHVDEKYARTTLVHLARYLHVNEFANSLVEQIDVDSLHRVVLVPRLGCEIVRLGELDTTAVRSQMAHLHTFYEKVLPTVGLNTYRELNLEYRNQIVCKKY